MALTDIPERRIGGAANGALLAAPDLRPVQTHRSPDRSWRRQYTLLLLVADLFAELLATLLCWVVRPQLASEKVNILHAYLPYLLMAVFLFAFWPLSLLMAGAYRARYLATGLRDYRIPLVTAVRLMALVAIASFALKAPLSRALVVLYFPALLAATLLCRWVAHLVLAFARKRGKALNKIVIAGDLAAVQKLAKHLVRSPALGYVVAGICAPSPGLSVNAIDVDFPILGVPDDVVEAAKDAAADTVVIAGHAWFDQMTLQQVAWRLEQNSIALFVAPDITDMAGPRIKSTAVSGLPLLHIAEARIGGPGRLLKPIYERALGLMMLLATMPLGILVALLIYLDCGRPIFFRQQRVGRGGELFAMLKFRTMVPDAERLLPNLRADNEATGALFKLRSDPRVTRSGRFLRKHSLDELPQLINVLRGEMVLVGPRPCLPSEAITFSEASNRRFLARPGMTGLWQISGRSDISWSEAVQLDLYYVENWSPFLDFVILWRTVRVILRGSGAY